ncbi:MAG: glycosyltransferase family 4 protein [Nanoarchaeota archaeon]
MKIKSIFLAHDSFTYWSGESGKPLKQFIADDFFSLTAQQIKKYYPEIEIECWCPEKTYDKMHEFDYNGIKYKQFPTTLSLVYATDFSISMLKELRKEAEKSKKEGYKLILHVHEIHNVHGILIAKLFKGENIIVQHHGGSWPLKHLKQTKRYKFFFPFFFLAQVFENKWLKNVKYYYALSNDEIKYLKNVAPESKIKFQTMGIGEYLFKKIEKKTARKKLGLNIDKKIIIYLGRVNQVKGVKILIDTMKGLPDIELKILGYGPQKDEFETYAKELGLKNVKFFGGVFGEDKHLYLSAADALILPSAKEGAPVVIMEAMASNLPVIVTDIGGTSIMVANKKNGIITERKPEKIAEAIKEILTWKPKDFSKYAELYRWKKIVDNTVKDYKEIK